MRLKRYKSAIRIRIRKLPRLPEAVTPGQTIANPFGFEPNVAHFDKQLAAVGKTSGTGIPSGPCP